MGVSGCPPQVHSTASAVRVVIWKPVSGLLKLALAAETGAVRGHIVTQNLTFAAAKPQAASGPSGLGPAGGRRPLSTHILPRRLQMVRAALRERETAPRSLGRRASMSHRRPCGAWRRHRGPGGRAHRTRRVRRRHLLVRRAAAGRRGGPDGRGVLLRRPRPAARPRLRRHLPDDDAGHRRGSRSSAASLRRLPSRTGTPGFASAYRIAFAGSVIAFVGASYTFSLQARSIRRWNLVRAQPAGAWPGGDHPAVAEPAAHPAYRHRDGDRDHGDPARLRLLLVPAERAGPGALPPGTRPPAREVRGDAARRGHARGGQHVPGPACALPGRPGGGPWPLRHRGLDHLGACAAGVRHRQRGLPPAAAQRVLSARSHRLQLAAVLASAGLSSAILLPVAAIASWLVPRSSARATAARCRCCGCSPRAGSSWPAARSPATCCAVSAGPGSSQPLRDSPPSSP